MKKKVYYKLNRYQVTEVLRLIEDMLKNSKNN